MVSRSPKHAPLTLAELRPAVHHSNFIRVDVGTVWGPRVIPDLELVFVLRGGLTYERVGTGITPVYAGDVLTIPPAEEHVLRCSAELSERGAAISCIHLELAAGQWRDGDYRLAEHPPLVTNTGGNPLFHHLFKRCSDTFEGYDPYRTELVSTIACEIWLHLASIWKLGTSRFPSPRTRRMQAYLRDRLASAVTRQDLARAFGMTPEYVNAIFKREVGVSPGAFLNRERVLLAYELLTYEGLTVKEAAYRTGFVDPFHFSKVFKKIMGIPPSHLLHRYGQLLQATKRT